MSLVRVAYVPGSNCSAIVVCHRCSRGGELGALGIKRVAVLVPRTAYGLTRCYSINHEDGVLGAINIWINAEAEQVLVIVCVHT